MPYGSVGDLPDAVKKLSGKKQRQWMAVFNSAFEAGDDEGACFAKAWGVVKKEGVDLYSTADESHRSQVAIGGKVARRILHECPGILDIVSTDCGIVAIVEGDVPPDKVVVVGRKAVGVRFVEIYDPKDGDVSLLDGMLVAEATAPLEPVPGARISFYKAASDEWSGDTYQVDAEPDEVKAFVQWWNSARNTMRKDAIVRFDRRSLEINNLGRGRIKLGLSWTKVDQQETETLLGAAWEEFAALSPPPLKKVRRTPEEVAADAVAVPPLDPLLLETLQVDVEPYLDEWGAKVVDMYTRAWQLYEAWADATSRDENGNYRSLVTRRLYRLDDKGARPEVRAYLEDEVFKQSLSWSRVHHPLLQWQYKSCSLEEMRLEFESVAEEFKEYARVRLLQAVWRYLPPRDDAQVVSVSHANLRDRQGTLEGTWEIEYSDGVRKSLKTQMIWAGGYNIQRLHTRYLVHVRDVGVVDEATVPPDDAILDRREILTVPVELAPGDAAKIRTSLGSRFGHWFAMSGEKRWQDCRVRLDTLGDDQAEFQVMAVDPDWSLYEEHAIGAVVRWLRDFAEIEVVVEDEGVEED